MNEFISEAQKYEEAKIQNERSRIAQGKIFFCESCEKHFKKEDFDIENKWCIDCIEILLQFSKLNN